MEEALQNYRRKRIRLKDFDYSTPRPYFITVCARNKESLFVNPKLNYSIIERLKEEKNRMGYKIFVYCLMPNHLHLLLAPSKEKTSISSFMGAFKSLTTRFSWDHGISGKLWQGRFHDRIVRKNEDLKTIGEYILENPVRWGMVSRWQDYPFVGLIDSWF